MQKTTKSLAPHQLEKVFANAGTGLLVLSVIACVFDAWINRRFIHQPLDYSYYLSYALLMAGGYLIGYFAANKNKRLTGFGYGVLAFMISFAIDSLRTIPVWLGNIEPSYPWSMILFEGGPLISLAVTAIIAVILRSTAPKNAPTVHMKLTVGLFVFTQLAMLATQGYYIFVNPVQDSANVDIFGLMLGALLSPIIIASIGYAVLGQLKQQLSRLYYAMLIGTIPFLFQLIVWKFRTNPEVNASEQFGSVVTVLTIVLIALLLWASRRATARTRRKTKTI